MYNLYRADSAIIMCIYIFIFRFIENDINGKSRIGVMPRFGDAESIIWFDVENHCSYHLFNCLEDGNEVIPVKSKMTYMR